MTLSPALERFATLIADNVVSAYIRESESSRGLGLPVREIVVRTLFYVSCRPMTARSWRQPAILPWPIPSGVWIPAARASRWSTLTTAR